MTCNHKRVQNTQGLLFWNDYAMATWFDWNIYLRPLKKIKVNFIIL